jgi:hypothetical protein
MPNVPRSSGLVNTLEGYAFERGEAELREPESAVSGSLRAVSLVGRSRRVVAAVAAPQAFGVQRRWFASS